MNSFYDFEAEDARCELHKMEEYRGKVVLVVNTATQCGFTQQYDDLQRGRQLDAQHAGRQRIYDRDEV